MKKFFALILLLIALVVLVLLSVNAPKKNISKTGNYSSESPIIIVPHFDTFKSKRQELLFELGGQYNPKKIVLLSVNHFALGKSDVITTDRQWDFKDVGVKVDKAGYSKIISGGIASGEENPFLSEHGIKNVLPDVALAFPEAEILPIIVKDTIKSEAIDKIFQEIESSLPGYMPIFSIDFSHYNPSSMAEIHDAYSIASLSNLDAEKAFLAETDSPQLMKIAVLWAQKSGREKFNLFYNSNSGKENKNLDVETTSVMIGYFLPGEKKTDDTSTFVFAGDVMLDRLVYHKFKDKELSRVFSKIGQRLFRGVDLSLANLEGPISDSSIDDNIAVDNLVFNFPPETPSALKYLNLNAVSLANNHTLNNGKSGLDNTLKVLDKASIKSVGRPAEIGDESILKIEAPIPISVIALNATSESVELDKLIEQEDELGRFVIVYPHWGAEYIAIHSNIQSKLASKWSEAGADLIIGSHPHVVQDLQMFEDTPTIYSLGNFVFDQGFSKATQQGLVIGGIITKESIKISFFPTEIENCQPRLMGRDGKSEIFAKLISTNSGYKLINSDTIEITRK